MNEEDKDLERLKAKRLAEMKKNISLKQIQDDSSELKEKQTTKPTAREIIVKKLGYRGLEVLENSERQFPNETKMIISKLGELISLGEINDIIDGGQLLSLFRSIGLNVRMETKITVEQDGKFVSLSDKFSELSNPNHNSKSE